MSSTASCTVFVETQMKQLLKLPNMLKEGIALFYALLIFAFYLRALTLCIRGDLDEVLDARFSK